MSNFYKILQINRSASTEQINSAYRKLATRFHPDRNTNKEIAEELFKQLQIAYETLSDPNKKLIYDKTLPKEKKVYKPVKSDMVITDYEPKKDLWGGKTEKTKFFDVFSNTYESEAIPDIR